MHLEIERRTERERKKERQAGKSTVYPLAELFHSGALLHIWLLLREGLGCTHSSPASLMCESSTHI